MRAYVLFAAAALYAAPVFALEPDTAVPVDISMIQEKDGISFQNTFAQPFYYWDKDAPGKSNCNAHCADIWIPVYPSTREATAIGDFSVVVRADGEKQWAYKGKPLYTFGYGDHEPPTAKETMGQWHVIKP